MRENPFIVQSNLKRTERTIFNLRHRRAHPSCSLIPCQRVPRYINLRDMMNLFDGYVPVRIGSKPIKNSVIDIGDCLGSCKKSTANRLDKTRSTKRACIRKDSLNLTLRRYNEEKVASGVIIKSCDCVSFHCSS